jgi:GT2 family glycosyltransferase
VAAPHASEAPTVGAIVTNFNGGDRVVRAVEALLRQKHTLDDVVVIDNGSSDGSPQRIRDLFPTVRLVELGENTGLSAARNRGLQRLETELAFLVDHDIFAEADAVELMLRAYTAQHPTVVCPRIRLTPERHIVQVEGAAPHFLGTLVLRHGYQPVDSLPRTAGWVLGAPGGCLLVDRHAVLEAGGFDESIFFYLEDLEFSLRLRGRGHRIWCEPNAEVYHEPAEGTPGLAYRGRGAYPPRRALLTMRHRLLTILVHYRLRTLLLLSPALLLYEIATLAVALRRGWLRQWAGAWLWQLRNRRAIAARRRSVQRARVVDDKDLLIGGEPPLAPGFIGSGLASRAFAIFSAAIDAYWRAIRRWIA